MMDANSHVSCFHATVSAEEVINQHRYQHNHN
jgi:hypothetical protein